MPVLLQYNAAAHHLPSRLQYSVCRWQRRGLCIGLCSPSLPHSPLHQHHPSCSLPLKMPITYATFLRGHRASFMRLLWGLPQEFIKAGKSSSLLLPIDNPSHPPIRESAVRSQRGFTHHRWLCVNTFWKALANMIVKDMQELMPVSATSHVMIPMGVFVINLMYKHST